MTEQENKKILDSFNAAIQATRELSERLLSASCGVPKASMNVATAIRCLEQAVNQHKSLAVVEPDVKAEPVAKIVEPVFTEVPEESKGKKTKKGPFADLERKQDDGANEGSAT